MNNLTNKTVLAVVRGHPKAFLLLRTAKRRAEELGALWEVVHVQTPDSFMDRGADSEKDNEKRIQLLETLALAEEMGALVTHVECGSFKEGVSKAIADRKDGPLELACVVIGEDESKSCWWGVGTCLHETIQQHPLLEQTEIIVVPLESEVSSSRSWLRYLRLHELGIKEIIYSLMAVGLANMAVEGLRAVMPMAMFRVNDENVALMFMIACAFISGRYGLIPGLVTALASFFSMNYFYLSPYYQFQFDSISDAINMALFLSAAFIIAIFGSRAKANIEQLMRQERRTQAMFRLHQVTSQVRDQDKVFRLLLSELERVLETRVAFFPLSQDNPDELDEPYCSVEAHFTATDIAARDRCFEDGITTGVGVRKNTDAHWRFEVLSTAEHDYGVIGMQVERGREIDVSVARLFSALALQVAAILERIQLGHMMQATKVREEREKLRSMLLSSVSHDLKTPLASIIGSLSVYRSMRSKLSDEHRGTLIETALDEAQRLDSFITNILDMTRIESGDIEFKKEWVDPYQLLNTVKRQIRGRMYCHDIHFPESGEMQEVEMDSMMTQQVLQNVLDNAAKYSPANSAIDISCDADSEGFRFFVRDHGKGIPEDKLESIFDKYSRLRHEDSKVAGTGLGLAICRSVMEAQGGTITASNHPDGGAVFTIVFPRWRKVTSRKKAMA